MLLVSIAEFLRISICFKERYGMIAAVSMEATIVDNLSVDIKYLTMKNDLLQHFRAFRLHDTANSRGTLFTVYATQTGLLYSMDIRESTHFSIFRVSD